MKYCVIISWLIFLSLDSYGFSNDTGNYKEWNYNPTSVFGVGRLNNTTSRTYYKISRDNNISKIEKINPKGLVIETYVFEFRNGIISGQLEIDRWNDTNRITRYQKISETDLLVRSKEHGKNPMFPCKGAICHFDSGMLTKLTYVSGENEAMNTQDGTAIVKYKRYTDENRLSLMQEQEYFDEDSRPATRSDYHKISYERDERGNVIWERYFDKKNLPIDSKFGVAVIKSTFDTSDNETRREYFDKSDRPAFNVYGVSKIHYIYQGGFCTETLYLDTIGTVAKTDSKVQSSIVKHFFDSSGNEVESSNYNQDEVAVNINAGYSYILYKFSLGNMLIGKAYYDSRNYPTTDRDGIHRYVYVKDQKNRKIEEYYFDNEDKPKKDRLDQVYGTKYLYDSNGLILSESHWADAHRKMNRWNGYHEIRSKYNDDGRCTEWSVYDQEGNLFKTKSGYSKQVQVFNDRGLLQERKWLHEDVPVLSNDSASAINGYHSVKYYYNKYGKVSYLEYCDTKGRPINATVELGNNIMRVHKIEFNYRGNDIISENLFVTDSDLPTMFIDCFQSEYVDPAGISRRPKISNK